MNQPVLGTFRRKSRNGASAAGSDKMAAPFATLARRKVAGTRHLGHAVETTLGNRCVRKTVLHFRQIRLIH